MRGFRSAESDAGIQDTGKRIELIANWNNVMMPAYKIEEKRIEVNTSRNNVMMPAYKIRNL